MRKRVPIVLIIILLILVSLTFLFIKPAFKYVSGFLSKSEQVKADVLLVEGWVPDYAVKLAYEEFKKNGYRYIITTGMKSDIPYYRIWEDGYLIFYVKDKLSGFDKPGSHLIEISAYSELGGENRAHFNLFINDSLKSDFYVEKSKKKYKFNWVGNLNKLDSITVQFNNDAYGDFGDRNLYVKSVEIDKKILSPYLNNSAMDYLRIGGNDKTYNNFNSNAEEVRNFLLSMGIDSSKVIATPCNKVKINRTLTSALAFRDWLKTSGIDIKGINIVSVGTHARRTWMTYNKVLNEKYNIGIISISDNEEKNSNPHKLLKTIRETLGILYYWIILLPY
jgi:hypothetical protein